MPRLFLDSLHQKRRVISNADEIQRWTRSPFLESPEKIFCIFSKPNNMSSAGYSSSPSMRSYPNSRKAKAFLQDYSHSILEEEDEKVN
jgi:hypothetical protein